MNWKKFKEEKPSEGEEVLAYHPSWIDEEKQLRSQMNRFCFYLTTKKS